MTKERISTTVSLLANVIIILVLLSHSSLQQENINDSTPTFGLLTITMPNLTISSNKTTYMCHTFRIRDLIKEQYPLMFEKYSNQIFHVTKYSAILSNPSVTHHMIVYGCPGDASREFSQIETLTNNQPFSCYGRGINVMSKCYEVTFGWAVGGQDFELPNEAGFPIGNYFLQSTDYVVLEVHYNNPSGKEGLIDSSGFSLNFTSNLRPYNAAIMTLGSQLQTMIIPPNTESTIVSNTCSSNCTKEMKGNINVYASLLHMHLLGKEIYTTVTRVNESFILSENRHYDFNMQTFQRLEPYKILQPGDQLTTVCNYNSIGKNETTFGGESTDDEMCFNFLAYYPRENGLTACIGLDEGKNFCVKPPSSFLANATATADNFSKRIIIKRGEGMESLVNKKLEIVNDFLLVISCFAICLTVVFVLRHFFSK
ncbi:hypothetical protein ABK040_002903 [Willaertia magna]